MDEGKSYIAALRVQAGLLEEARDQALFFLSELGHSWDGMIEEGAKHYLGVLEKIETAERLLQWQEEGGLIEILQELNVGDEVADRSTSVKQRRIVIEVTQGMINQSLLTLTEAKKGGVVKEDEKFSVQLPDDREFTSTLVQPGNRFSERGAIKHFYKRWKIKAGDEVLLKEVEPTKWILKKYDPIVDPDKMSPTSLLVDKYLNLGEGEDEGK